MDPGDSKEESEISGRGTRSFRGTRSNPLPLLPSGPGGVHGALLHGAWLPFRRLLWFITAG
ncbi:hypothetical protein LptCag_2379 [Leptospirillum ferriphilum]|uniref:Uncharacterized protein n=1 Tax=Leptospirillum ferriphilum TaxID=178606 RepID=A0A094WEH9_9BACT|nr:hypothetical protein LptCag_2379 [Leptospirillum ferriphilum]